MRIPTYGLVLGISTLLAADIPSDLLPVAPQIIQGGALAVLAGTIWYMLAKTFPAWTAALKDQRDAFLAYLEKRDERQEE
jgi:hypothetical protein